MNPRCASGQPPLHLPDSFYELRSYDYAAGLVDKNCFAPNSRLPSRNLECFLTGDRTHMINEAKYLSNASGTRASFFGSRKVSNDHTEISNGRRESLGAPCEKLEVCNYILNSRLFPIPADFSTASMGRPSPNTCRILRVSIPLHLFRHPSFSPRCELGPDNSAQKVPAGHRLPRRSIEPGQLPGGASLLAHCGPNNHTPAWVTLASTKPRSSAALTSRSSVSLRSAVCDSGCSPDAEPSLPSWMRLQPRSESEILDELIRSSQVMQNRGTREGLHPFPSRLRPIIRPSQRKM